MDVRGNGLEYALEMGLAWARKQADGLRGMVQGRRRREPGEDPAYDYELSDHRPA